MFDIIIPAFQTIFAEIRDLIIPQNEVDYYTDIEVQDSNGSVLELFNWSNFYKYFSMDGLNDTTVFENEIENIPLEFLKYNHYSGYKSQIAHNTNCND